MKNYSGNSGDIDSPANDSSSDESLQELPARRGFSVFYRGKTLLSKIDPVAQAERLASSIDIKERTLYFCPSPIYGYGLSLLLEKLKTAARPLKSAILCVEADEKLYNLSCTAFNEMGLKSFTTEIDYHLPDNAIPDNADIDDAKLPLAIKPLVLVRAASPGELCTKIRETWGERQFRRVEELRLTAGWQLFPLLYDEMAKALRRQIAVEWGNALTLIRLGRLYTRNLIRNLALLPDSSVLPSLRFHSEPILALGAGPSLDHALDALALLWGGRIPGREERRFKIVCVDTCLPALRDRGIQPDLAVILESQHWNLRDFSGLRGWDVDAAIDLSALPASARVLSGKRFPFATRWTEISLFCRLEEAGLLPQTLPPLGSVGLSAVALALHVTIGPVITAGLDFSFSLDAYHARSTPGYREQEARQCRLRSIINSAAAFREGGFEAISKSGTEVRSDPAMRNYRSLFEEEFGSNPRILDMEGPGLALGVKIVSREEAFAVLNGSGEHSGKHLMEQQLLPPISGKDNPGIGAPEKDNQEKRNETGKNIAAFARREIETLEALKEMLTGKGPPNDMRLEELLDTCDYLWAHFPDCAGAGGRRPAASDLGFLKRVRTEIEPFIKLWEMTERAAGG